MQFNSNVNQQDLCTLTNDMLNSNNTTYSLADKARQANLTLKKIWFMIFDAYSGWQFDDRNNANLPIATTNLVSGQQDYSLPSEAFTIRDIELMPVNGTVFQVLQPLTQELINQYGLSEGSLFTSNGTPIFYRPIGGVIKLYPTPNYSGTNALRVTFDRGISTFVPTDTTKQPGIDSEFHEMVAVGMSLEYARRNSTSNFQFINEQWQDWSLKLAKDYLRRFTERFPPRMTVVDQTRQYQ